MLLQLATELEPVRIGYSEATTWALVSWAAQRRWLACWRRSVETRSEETKGLLALAGWWFTGWACVAVKTGSRRRGGRFEAGGDGDGEGKKRRARVLEVVVTVVWWW